MWSVASGECVTTKDLGDIVFGVALAGESVVSGDYGHKAEVWRIDGGATIHTLRHPGWVMAVEAADDLIVTACADGCVRTWSLATGELTRTLEHEKGKPLWGLCLYGTMVVSGGDSKTIKVWSLAGDGECVATLANGFNATSLAISPRGFIVAADRDGDKLEVWRC